MIDSVELIIEDLEHHSELVGFLHRRASEGISVYSKRLTDVSEEDLEKRSYNHTYFRDHTDGHEFERGYMGRLPSYHYDIAYRIEFDRGHILMNFSIPKYLYGTNVFQFVPHFHDRDYSDFMHQAFHTSWADSYTRLDRFLQWFFKKECGGLVDFRFVRFRRLDICFNKIFPSAADAEGYLHELKRIRKKFMRKVSSGSAVYNTTVQYVAKGYTFKMYLKGAEFKTHDFKELKQRGLYTTDELKDVQELADRVVRYEMEFKSEYLNRLFKKKVFRRSSEYWRKAMKIYNGISKSGYVVLGGEKLEYKDLNPWERKLYKYARHYYGKRFQFFIDGLNDSDDSGDEYYEIKHGDFRFPQHQKFGSLLFKECMRAFRMHYREMSITASNDLQGLLSKLNIVTADHSEINEQFRGYLASMNGGFEPWMNKIAVKTVAMFMQLLVNDTWAQIKVSGVVSETVYYRYRKVFKLFGMGDRVVTRFVPLSEDNFKDYYIEVNKNHANPIFRQTLKTKF